MAFWRENYKSKIGNKDFIEGIIEGVRAFAIWLDGEQRVGCMQRPLKEEITIIKEELGYED